MRAYQTLIELDGILTTLQAYNAALEAATGNSDMNLETQQELDEAIRGGFVTFSNNKTNILFDGI